jgi:hypothetical protein
MNRIVILLLVSIAACSLTLCTSDAADPPGKDGSPGKDSAAKDRPQPKRTAPPTKWDAKVLDVFFPDARQVLVGERPQYATMRAGSAGKNNEATAGGAADALGTWSKLISAETIQDEVKALSPLLADDVKTPQGFIGGAFKKSRKTLSELAAIFAIINEYDKDVRWKSQAAAARDLFARAGYNCKAATDNTFKEAKKCNEDLAALLRGDSITSPPNAEPKNDWGKVANLLPLMSRLELAQRDRIAPATSTASDFKKNSRQIAHEAEIVAALAETIARPGMDNAEDEKFRGYAKALKASAVDLRAAVDRDNYEAGNKAAGVMLKSCASCHADFR